MRSVVCFGEALIDFLAKPAAEGQPRSFVQNAGGAPANVAVAVARLGGRARFAGMLAEDMFGDFLFDSLSAMGVDTVFVRRTSEAPTALAFVSLAADGERSFSFYRPPAADLLFRDDDFDVALFEDAAVFHACSNSLTEEAIAQATLAGMRRARAAGALVSFDMNLRPALWPRGCDPAPRIRAVLAEADVVKLSAEELAFLGEDAEATLDELWCGPTQLVIVTDGAAALHWFTPRQRDGLPSFKVHAVDTTAAGDAFVGGLLFDLARREITPASLPAFVADQAALGATLRFASACGALAVTRLGAFAAMPSHADVENLVAQSTVDISP
jgi:fructokinase